MIKYILEWYYTWVVCIRWKRGKNRSEWFKGIPEWYVRDLATGDDSGESDDLRMIVRQARASLN